VANIKQLRLPKLKEVERIKIIRKLPQPRVSRFRTLKKFELIHRPFDLRFRGRINKWLNRIDDYENLDIRKVLDREQYKIIKLYFYPQKPESNWLNQNDILKKINIRSIKKLKSSLVSSLLLVWTKNK